ncbi:hypothetical protein [Candidatus Laterigemmans baculatus]|uniref:hypothetical protein n=1 Tax=Candidatus Laterigemmans baculatus TaxID=2770505 RepID=UPI0013DA06CE|nr:hypothetical protein [Candidatus Laterigemmans baculatus]
MAFLSGSIAFERFRVAGSEADTFGPEHLEVLEQYRSGQFQTSSTENIHVGFLAGGHLFDHAFDLEKNVINDALHCAVRIDTNQIPSPIRKAWLQMELAAIMRENPDRRPTKAQRQEAKDAVEQRCEDEAKTGKYLRMQQSPVLWDARHQMLYFGGSSATAAGHAADLFERAFEVELHRVTVGKLAQRWAEGENQLAAFDAVTPSSFHPHHSNSTWAWLADAEGLDFLGNEFLLWLWWYLESESDTIALADGSEVTAMFAKTLTLECPLGETGKEVISSESPVRLPEAMEAIRSGKLPRKAGLILVRDGQQYDLVLQAETFGIGGAKVQADEDSEGRAVLEERIDAIRNLSETVDLLFHAFCQRRIGNAWGSDLERLRGWLQSDAAEVKRPAA